jgi:hypothetical protein
MDKAELSGVIFMLPFHLAAGSSKSVQNGGEALLTVKYCYFPHSNTTANERDHC